MPRPACSPAVGSSPFWRIANCQLQEGPKGPTLANCESRKGEGPTSRKGPRNLHDSAPRTSPNEVVVASAPWALHRRSYGPPQARSSTPHKPGFRAICHVDEWFCTECTIGRGRGPPYPHIHINPQGVVHIVCRQPPLRLLFRARINGSRGPSSGRGVSGSATATDTCPSKSAWSRLTLPDRSSPLRRIANEGYQVSSTMTTMGHMVPPMASAQRTTGAGSFRNGDSPTLTVTFCARLS